MLIRVAVFDPLPVFRRGVMATLDHAGFDADAPDDLLAWARDEERRLVLLTLLAPADWALLAELLRIRPGIEVIALLGDASVVGYLRALTAGAVGAVPRDAAPALVRETFEAVLRGRSLLPVEVLRAFSAGAAPTGAEAAADLPSAREIEWLRELARGVTVGRLAGSAGYSERMMFRLLRGTYAKLDAGNRTEALMNARARGLL